MSDGGSSLDLDAIRDRIAARAQDRARATEMRSQEVALARATPTEIETLPSLRRVVFALADQFPGQVQWHPGSEEWLFPCPVHPETYPSLLVYPDELGRAILDCCEGCFAPAIANAAGLQREDIANPVRELDDDAPRSRFRLLTDLELEQLPPVTFLVDGVIPRAGLGTLYGAPGAGKSFLALDMACCIATGAHWLGLHATKQGSVVYVAAEGSAGLRQRLRAWKAYQGIAGASLPIHFLTEPANLLGTADVASLLQAFEQLKEVPSLVIVDTLHRSMPGGDENSAQDMGLVIEHADALRRKTGASVLLVHHTALNSERERGSSSLRGAMDALLHVKSDDLGKVLKCEKAKDWAPFEDVPFRLQVEGESCVVLPAESGGTNEGSGLTQVEQQILHVLGTSFLDDGATFTAWLEVSEKPKTTFHRYVTRLVRSGYVNETKRGNSKRFMLTDSGRFAIGSKFHLSSTQVPLSLEQSSSTVPHPFRGGTGGTDPERLEDVG